MWKKLRPYIGFSAAALAMGGLAGLASKDSMAEYANLLQPPLAPPGGVFPAMWSVLYILMGISAGIVWKNAHPSDRRSALAMWWIQLAVNALWTVIYFNLEWRLFAFFWLLALLCLVIVMTVQFYKVRPAAGRLNYPYILWLGFAAYLNLATWLLNG